MTRRRNIPDRGMDGTLPPTNIPSYIGESKSGPLQGLPETVEKLVTAHQGSHHVALSELDAAVAQLKTAGEYLAGHRPANYPESAKAGDRYIPDLIALLSLNEVSKLFMDRIFAAFPGQAQNSIIRKYGSPTSAFFSHIREQADTVEMMLREAFSRHGVDDDLQDQTIEQDDSALSPKEAMNFWFKMQKMISDELPRIISMERQVMVEELMVDTIGKYLSENERKEFQSELSKRINEKLSMG